jgi:hypothetical protein
VLVEDYWSGILPYVLFQTNIFLFLFTRHVLGDEETAINNTQVILALLEFNNQ